MDFLRLSDSPRIEQRLKQQFIRSLQNGGRRSSHGTREARISESKDDSDHRDSVPILEEAEGTFPSPSIYLRLRLGFLLGVNYLYFVPKPVKLEN